MSRAGFKMGDEFNDYETSSEDTLARLKALLIGKTIADVSMPRDLFADDVIVIRLDDGSAVTMVSWDYEGYSSGIYLFDREPPESGSNGDGQE